MLHSIWLPRILLFISGCLSPFAFSPHHMWWLPFLQFAVFAYLLERHPSQSAAKLGFAFGFGWFITGVNWVHVSLEQFGGMPLAVALLSVSGLAAYLALYPALAAWAAEYLGKPFQSRIIALPLTWTIAEWLRGEVMTGFPWLSVGYSQIAGPLRELFPIIGEFGVNFVVLGLVVVSCYLVKHRHSLIGKPLSKVRYIAVSLTLSLMLLVLLPVNMWHQATGQSVNLALIQGNVQQSTRWQPDNMMPIVRQYMAMSEPHYHSADIVIWPEAAIPIVEPYAQDILSQLDPLIASQNATLITGIVDYRRRDFSYFNRLITLGKKTVDEGEGHYYYGHDNRYAKHHLLPIGEFVPFQDFLREIAPIFNLPHSSFRRGSYVQPNLLANGFHLLPAICFEIVFAEQIAANLTEETDFILTVSNDAWFGDSVGPHQHLQIAQARALEFGKPVVRVTNNGITAIIDANGDIIARAPQFAEAVIEHQLQLVTSSTPYSQWQNRPMYGLLSLLLLGFIALNFRRSR